MFNKQRRRRRIQNRIRKKISGTSNCPRLSVFRSNKSIYCQLIDDVNQVTLAAASSKEASIEKEGTKTEQAKKVGQLIADKAKGLNLDEVIFDRSGYLYHGRIKSLAEGARKEGLKF